MRHRISPFCRPGSGFAYSASKTALLMPAGPSPERKIELAQLWLLSLNPLLPCWPPSPPHRAVSSPPSKPTLRRLPRTSLCRKAASLRPNHVDPVSSAQPKQLDRCRCVRILETSLLADCWSKVPHCALSDCLASRTGRHRQNM